MKTGIIVFIIILILQFIFYNVVYFISNEPNMGFKIGGMTFYIICLGISIILLVKPLNNTTITNDDIRPVIKMFYTYGIIGIIGQIILGYILNCEPETFLFIHMMILISTCIMIIRHICCSDYLK